MIGYRKTSIAALYLTMTYIALAMGWVTGADWLKYTSMVLAAYMGAMLFDTGRKDENE